MKKLTITLSFLFVATFCHAQSDSIKAAYQQVCTTLKEYKFLSKDAYDGHGKTKSILLTLQNGHLVFTFNDDFSPYNDSFFGNKAGKKKISIPIEHATIYLGSWYSRLELSGTNGIEMTYRGKKEILEKYTIHGEKLTLQKLEKELGTLLRVAIQENFQGTLGWNSSSPKKGTTKASPVQGKSNDTSMQPRQRNRVPSGN